jgi:hypothetical protein
MMRRWSRGLIARVFLCTALVFGAVSAACAQCTGPEYRLKTKDGVPFAFDHAEEQFFSPHPFMTAADFASVSARKSKNPNTPDNWEVVLTHTPNGRVKLRAVADADRSREFCLVFQRTLYFCEAFPPVMKGVYDKDRSVTGNFDKAKAEKLAADMRREIAKARR